MKRTFFIDPDFRPMPKTQSYCCVCQKDLKGKSLSVWLNEGCFEVVHPADMDGTEILGKIGADCAKKIPKEFFIP